MFSDQGSPQTSNGQTVTNIIRSFHTPLHQRMWDNGEVRIVPGDVSSREADCDLFEANRTYGSISPGKHAGEGRPWCIIHSLARGAAVAPTLAALPGSLPDLRPAIFVIWPGQSLPPDTRYHLSYPSTCPSSNSTITFLFADRLTASFHSFSLVQGGEISTSVLSIVFASRPNHHDEEPPSISSAIAGGWLASPRRYHP